MREEKLILGIDESGRGPVIGPLVVVGALAYENDSDRLKVIGVKDSKMLSPHQRERLYPLIKKILKDYVIIKIPAKKIDELRREKNLNMIEAEVMAQIIKAMKADIAYIDTPQVSVEKFKKILLNLAGNKTKLICENYAEKYPICAAASIIAKVERDKEIRKIERKNKIFVRTGYPHDEYTIKFLKNCKGNYPDFVRKSWVTVSELKTKKEQKTLKEYKRNK